MNFYSPTFIFQTKANRLIKLLFCSTSQISMLSAGTVLLLFFIGTGCGGNQSVESEVNTKKKTISSYLKEIQKSPDGIHLFGHESAIMMGVSGASDWEIKNVDQLGSDIMSQKSDVLKMTGNQPAIMGYDAFKLILDITDNKSRMPEVEASIKGLKTYIDHGGLIAFNWHIQPVKLPAYRERAYRMDEFNNNPYIEQMKKEKPFYNIANGFESKNQWWMAYENNRLSPMAERLKMISKDGSGIIFRPFHEADGSWFWWGLEWLEGDQELNGKKALQKVFIETARYLKKELPELLIAFSTDKLDYVNHNDTDDQLELAQRYSDEFKTYLPDATKDLDLVDIYGMDLYINADNPSRFDDYSIKLQGLTLLANEHDKICAITEAGNRGLPSEEDGRQPCINWYSDYLAAWIEDPKIDIAFNVVWQNWSNNRDRNTPDPADGYFVPVYPDSEPGVDFINYIQKPESLMLNDLKNTLSR